MDKSSTALPGAATSRSKSPYRPNRPFGLQCSLNPWGLDKVSPTKGMNETINKKSAKTSFLLRGAGQRRVLPVKQVTIKAKQGTTSLTHFDKPREALSKTLEQLNSKNWELNVEGLKCMVRLICYHTDLLSSQIDKAYNQVTRSIRNLRSQVAHAACEAATELFKLQLQPVEWQFDELVCALLQRTVDTNRFIRADVNLALESMVDHVQPTKVLNILTAKGADSPNSHIKTASVKLLLRLVEHLGNDRIYGMKPQSKQKFFSVGANLLREGSLETRNYAKSMFRALSKHVNYKRTLQEAIPEKLYCKVENVLDNLKPL